MREIMSLFEHTGVDWGLEGGVRVEGWGRGEGQRS